MNLDVGNGFRLTDFRRSDRATLVFHLAEKEIYDRTLRIPYPYTIELANHWLDYVETCTRQGGNSRNWVIRDADDQLVGSIGLEMAGTINPLRAELGYWLAKPFWGRGIMTAVVRAACDYSFQTIGLTKITAHVFAFNHGSARVLEKSGFELEGFFKNHYLKDGQYIDSRVFGRLRPD